MTSGPYTSQHPGRAQAAERQKAAERAAADLFVPETEDEEPAAAAAATPLSAPADRADDAGAADSQVKVYLKVEITRFLYDISLERQASATVAIGFLPDKTRLLGSQVVDEAVEEGLEAGVAAAKAKARRELEMVHKLEASSGEGGLEVRRRPPPAGRKIVFFNLFFPDIMILSSI